MAKPVSGIWAHTQHMLVAMISGAHNVIWSPDDVQAHSITLCVCVCLCMYWITNNCNPIKDMLAH